MIPRDQCLQAAGLYPRSGRAGFGRDAGVLFLNLANYR